MTKQFEAVQPQSSVTRFALIDLPFERIVMLAKEQRAAYLAGLFAAGRAWLAEYSRSLRSMAPTSMVRSVKQA